LLIAAVVEGLRVWGEALGAWAPLATVLLMVIQALAAPIPTTRPHAPQKILEMMKALRARALCRFDSPTAAGPDSGERESEDSVDVGATFQF
jgi:hypothetical protein